MTFPALVIADDEAAICFALARTARRARLDPLVAADGRRAVALAAAAGVLVAAILDVQMPGLGGVDAGLTIRAARPAVPVALMTAFDFVPPAPFAPDRMFRKPFDLEAFAALRTPAAA